MLRFIEFNTLYNPGGEACYVHLNNGQPVGKATQQFYANIITLTNTDPFMEIGWTLPQGYVVIETQQKNLLALIQKNKEKLLVIESRDKIEIVAKGNYTKSTVNNTLACGALADVKTFTQRKTIITLPFYNPKTSQVAQKKTIAYFNDIDQLPTWLTPNFKTSRSDNEAVGFTFPIVSDTQETLRKIAYSMRMSSLTGKQRVEVLEQINKILCNFPLSDDKFEEMLKSNREDLMSHLFFDPVGNFYHNLLGDYLIQSCSIKRDDITKKIYYYDEQKNIYRGDDDYLLSVMTRLCPTLKDFQKQEVLKYVNQLLVTESYSFNQNPFTIVFKNGILNLETMKFETMTKDHYETIKVNVNYNPPSGPNKMVDDFFDTLTQGNKQVETLLYEAIGYAMLKTNDMQKSFVLVGEGRNGKSTYLEVVKNVLGVDNVATLSFKDMANNFRISMLEGKLASVSADISNQPLTDSDLFKSIVGGDPITVEKKYEHAHSNTMFATIFLAANKLPRTPDTTFGFFRKFCIIPFDASLTKIKQVEGMAFKMKLLSQENLDYVAYKSVAAFNNVLHNTYEFTEPTVVTQMLDKYRAENSSILSWIEDHYKGAADSTMGQSLETLYTQYVNWCDQNNYKSVRKSRFKDEFQRDTKLKFTPGGLVDTVKP